MRRRRVVGLREGARRDAKWTHPALDYAILSLTRGERLISTAEFSEVSGLVGRRVRMLAREQKLPAIWAHGGYWFAFETAFLVRSIREDALARGLSLQSIQYLPATDRHGYKERYEANAGLRKKLLLGQGGRIAAKQEASRQSTRRWRARIRASRPPTPPTEKRKRRIRVMSIDPFTRDDIVVWTNR